MKKFTLILISLFASVVLFAQTPTNYKEGDFSGKALKAKTITLDNNWEISKTSAGVMTLKYNKTSVATLSAAGTLTPTALTTGTMTASAVATATTASTTSVTTPRVILTAVAASDTTTKIIGFKVIGTQLYYGNGTFYYKVTYAN